MSSKNVQSNQICYMCGRSGHFSSEHFEKGHIAVGSAIKDVLLVANRIQKFCLLKYKGYPDDVSDETDNKSQKEEMEGSQENLDDSDFTTKNYTMIFKSIFPTVFCATYVP